MANPPGTRAAGDTASQFAGLFVQACLSHPFSAATLRQWAAQTGLQALPPSRAGAFLHGAQGKVFDASTQQGKLALLSLDSGECRAAGADQQATAARQALLAALAPLGLPVTLQSETADAEVPELRHAKFQLQAGARRYTIVLSATAPAGPAMLALTAP